MGQLVFGIIFGVRIPNDLDVCNDKDGLLDKWEAAMKEEIDALRNDPSLEAYEIGRYRIVPDVSEEYEVLGFWVAVGGRGLSKKKNMESPISFASFEKDDRYTIALEKAKDRWFRFALWAESHQGILFQIPELWLAQTEVA